MNRCAVIGMVWTVRALVTTGVIGAHPLTRAAEYAFTDLGTLGRSSAGYAVNNNGQAVGSSTTPGGDPHAFVWSHGEMKDLGTLGGRQSQACGINDRGDVVGWSLTQSGRTHAFLYSNGAMVDIGSLLGDADDSSLATDINNAGAITGYHAPHGELPHPFLYLDGKVTDLGIMPGPYPQGVVHKINRHGAAVGQSNDRSNQPRAVRYSDGRITELGTLGGPFSFANGINDRGEIVGHAYSSHMASSAFVYSDGVLRSLGTLGGHYSSARAINESGIIVGESAIDDGPGTHAFVYAGDAMVTLNRFPGWIVEAAYDINDDGQIVGTAIATDGSRRAFLLTPLGGERFAAVPHLAHVSVRASVRAEDPPLLVGFVIGGSRVGAGKAVLLRAVGPTLREFGVAAPLPAPLLVLSHDAMLLAQNGGWRGGFDFASAGAFDFAGQPPDDAALVARLAPGAYTVEISDRNGAAGIAMAEIYDATPADAFATVTPRVTNVSACAHVGAGDAIVIAGFVVAGDRPVRLLIRSVGSALADFGIADALADPVLAVFSGNSEVARLGRNDDWETALDDAEGAVELAGACARAGAFQLPAGSRDAAVVRRFPPGAYTVQFSGAAGTTGVALVEIYEVPDPPAP